MKVVVIGAGVTGLGIGWKLAEAGAAVMVLERAQVGSGASAVSCGMIETTAFAAGSPGDELATRAIAAWPAFKAALEKQSRIDIGFHRNGLLLARMKGEAAGEAAGEVLAGGKARQLEPLLGEGVGGAVLLPDAADVDCQALIRALAVALVRAGGAVRSNEAAVRLEWDGSRVTGVATPFAVHHADAFVLATGAWASRIEGLPKSTLPPIAPVKGEAVVLVPPPGARMPERPIWGNEICVVPRRGRLLVGATGEAAGFDTTLSQAAVRWLYRQSTAMMPSLIEWHMAEHWAGLRAIAPDGLPVLGMVVPGLYVASGQYRAGIQFAPAVIEDLSRLILERTAAPPAFDPRRFGNGGPGVPVAETPHKDVSGEADVWRTGS